MGPPMDFLSQQAVKVRLRDLAIAFSLSNLCFISTWNELLNSPIRRFNTGLAIIISVLMLAAARGPCCKGFDFLRVANV